MKAYVVTTSPGVVDEGEGGIFYTREDAEYILKNVSSHNVGKYYIVECDVGTITN